MSRFLSAVIILSRVLIVSSSYTCNSPKRTDSPIVEFVVSPEHNLKSGPINVSVTCTAKAQNIKGIAYHKMWIKRNDTTIDKSLSYCWPDPPNNTGRHVLECNRTVYLDRSDFGPYDSVTVFCKSQPQTYHCTLISTKVSLLDRLPTTKMPSMPTSTPISTPTSNPIITGASREMNLVSAINGESLGVLEITGLVTGSVALFAIVVSLLIFAHRRQSCSNTHSDIESQPISPISSPGEDYGSGEFAIQEGMTLSISQDRELGIGKFGKVFLGKLRVITDEEDIERDVAVKILRDFNNENHKRDFQNEGENLKRMNHVNVVKFMAAYFDNERCYIVTEFLSNGSLLNLLRRERDNPPTSIYIRQLYNFALDIGSGMKYLTENKIIHRDLAARNILVAEDYTCKISDFGLARSIENYGHYIQTRGYVAMKWVALEVFDTWTFTVQTDIWSFGILLWEIFSLGEEPYMAIDNEKSFVALPDYLRQGNRLEKPDLCSDVTYDIMMKCWSRDPNARPSFEALTEWARPLADVC